jgi:hypothetical protein
MRFFAAALLWNVEWEDEKNLCNTASFVFSGCLKCL